ncbi:MAG TPA: L,D-transpeptidase [Coxiellaceae bacterium]|nr:L,D-transpeptidase [Coxiellaceae bacterium]
MLLRILLVSVCSLLALGGCAKKNLDPEAPYVPDFTLTEAEDPDGNGENKGADYFPMHRAATGNKVFIFDPNYGAWAVYDAQGNRVNVGRASGGATRCEHANRSCKTITGTYRIIDKKGPDCISSKYPIETRGGAAMPYCMHFQAKGYAIHGSPYVPNHNASHGCIRVESKAAEWLSQSFLNVGSTVIVLPYQNTPPPVAVAAQTN